MQAKIKKDYKQMAAGNMIPDFKEKESLWNC